MLKCPKCYSVGMRRHSFTEAGKQRYSCKACNHRTVNPIGLDQLDPAIDQKTVSKKLKKIRKKKVWLVTAAQNATPPDKNWLASLHTYCDHRDAELVVIPIRYKNPTSVFADKDHDWWHPDLAKHLVDKRYELCPGLILLGDIQVQPTAVSPLTGLEGFTGVKSGIVGHPKYQFRTVATRQGDMPKIMTTTGAVTIPNYTKSKAGKRGAEAHHLGATVVEWDGKFFHLRQISADPSGAFIDLDKRYTPDGVEVAPRPKSIVLGDLHQWWVCKEVDKATFGKKGLIDRLNPEHVFLHDVVDGFSISHHHRQDPFKKYAKQKFGKGNILQEITDFAAFMTARMKDGVNYHIVPSNHDDHITRYIKETDWRNDPENAKFYLHTALYMVENVQMNSWGDSTPRPFDYWIKRLCPRLNVLSRDQSFEILGVEHNYHGDIGPNGARGTTKNLTKIGVKVTSGHVHSPAAEDGVMSVGTSTGRMAYAVGPSGWLNTHCILNADGTRTFIHCIGGKFWA